MGEKADLRRRVASLRIDKQDLNERLDRAEETIGELRLGLELADAPDVKRGDRVYVSIRGRGSGRYYVVEATGRRRENGRGGHWEGLELHLKLDPRQAQSQTIDDVERQALHLRRAGDRVERLRRDLAALHATHKREKRGRRKEQQRISRLERERDDALRARVKAERSCEALRRERDEYIESRGDRDATIERMRRHDEATATLQHEAQQAIDAEVELKHAAVRTLRRAMRNAINALGSVSADFEGGSTVSGAAQHLREALVDVYDPDDGGVH